VFATLLGAVVFAQDLLLHLVLGPVFDLLLHVLAYRQRDPFVQLDHLQGKVRVAFDQDLRVFVGVLLRGEPSADLEGDTLRPALLFEGLPRDDVAQAAKLSLLHDRHLLG